jgi:hypothetical protein
MPKGVYPRSRPTTRQILAAGGPSDPSECWIWPRDIPDGDYPSVRWGAQKILLHRLAWELASGAAAPDDRCVLHTCDVRACWRNDYQGVYELGGRMLPRYGHLFLGTRQDNNDDCHRKGRGIALAGASHWNAKLTEDQALWARERYSRGDITQWQLAEMLSVRTAAVHRLLAGRSWRHLAEGSLREGASGHGRRLPN